MMDASAAVSVILGSSPTGHPTKNPLMLCIGGFFYLAGVSQWDSNKAALTHQRQSNQQPSGLLISARVPSLRNVYRGTFCRCSKQRIFLFGGGIPVGLEQHAIIFC